MLRNVFVLFTAAAVPVLVWLYGPHEARSVALQSLKHDREDIDLSADTVRAHLENIEALSKLELAHGPATDFWHSDASAEAERIERILAAERSARAALIEHFGPQIAAAPVFWRLFRPLHERMPQLTYLEQTRIHELEREFVARGLRSGSGPSFNEHLIRVREQLGADIANEYALRSSPFASELRQVGVELSEAGFRDAFAALSELSAATNREAFVAARSQLRGYIGNRAFARLWSQHDPRFDRIESVAERLGLPEETILTAYALLLENQDSMLAAISPSDAATQQARVRDQFESGRRRLQELIGTRATEALLQAAAGPPRQVSEDKR